MSTKLFLPSLLECKLANDPCRSNTFTTGYVFHTITDMKIGMSLALFKDAWKDAGLTGSLAFNKIRSSFATKVSTSYHKSVDIVYNFLSSLSSTKSCQNCPMYQMWYKHRWHSVLAKYTLACRLKERAIEPLTFGLADDRFPSSVKLCTRLTHPWYPMCQRKAQMWYSVLWVHCTGMRESVARCIKNQRLSWIIMPQREGWKIWTSWWPPTSCERRTLYWPLVIFFDISAYNALASWMALNPEWNTGKL